MRGNSDAYPDIQSQRLRRVLRIGIGHTALRSTRLRATSSRFLLLGEDPLARAGGAGYPANMIHSASARVLLTLVVVLGWAGCSSPTGRSVRGVAAVGDTRAVVQRTMGKPDEKQDGPDDAREQSVWIYKSYFQQIERRQQAGWKEVLMPGVNDRNGNQVQKPVTRDVYRTQLADDIRVTFEGGTVSSVDHLKR